MKDDISKFVGKKIRYYRKLNGMTQKELGEKIGVKHNTISSYENGTNEPEQDILFSIARTFEISIDDLFPSIDDEKTNVSVINEDENEYLYFPTKISAGVPLEVDDLTKKDIEKIMVPDEVMGKWSQSKDIFMVRVNGESMNKVIPHNSLIAVKPVELHELKNNDIVIFSDNGDYSIKRFFHDQNNERVIFRPDSTDDNFYDYIVSYEVAKNLKIHGKVVLYIVELD